jgi:hypothetical protein
MKRRILSAFALLAMATLFTVAASAQDRAQADIPFEFRVGAKALPSGSYEVSNILGIDSAAMLVRNSKTGNGAAILAKTLGPGTDSGEAALVFHRYGDRYFLSSVRTPEATRDLPMTKLERELASDQAQSAANDSGPQVIYIAARL